MNRILCGIVLAVCGIGAGLGSVPFIQWANSPPRPISDGAKAIVESLESGNGWRLGKHGDGVVNENANVVVDIANWKIRRWNGDEAIEWYPRYEYRAIMNAAKDLKKRLLPSYFKNVEPGPKMEPVE